jgi:hypothetical protein
LAAQDSASRHTVSSENGTLLKISNAADSEMFAGFLMNNNIHIYFAMIILALALVSAFAEGVASNRRSELHAHLKALVDSLPGQRPALSAAAAGPLLHVHLPLFVMAPSNHRANLRAGPDDTAEAAFFEVLLDHESALRAAAPRDSRHATVLCGPQRTAKAARAGITAASGSLKPPQVIPLPPTHIID